MIWLMSTHSYCVNKDLTNKLMYTNLYTVLVYLLQHENEHERGYSWSKVISRDLFVRDEL